MVGNREGRDKEDFEPNPSISHKPPRFVSNCTKPALV